MQCGIGEMGFETTQPRDGIMSSKLTSGLVFGKCLNHSASWFFSSPKMRSNVLEPNTGPVYHRYSVNICWFIFFPFLSLTTFFLSFLLFIFLKFYLRLIKISSVIRRQLEKFEYWIFIDIIEWRWIFRHDNCTIVIFLSSFFKDTYWNINGCSDMMSRVCFDKNQSTWGLMNESK